MQNCENRRAFTTSCWRDSGGVLTAAVNCYNNGVALTVSCCHRILAERQLPLSAFVYFAGSALKPWNAASARPATVHVRDDACAHLLVWLSDVFMVDEPDRVNFAPQPRGSSVLDENDLLYDLLIGLTGIDDVKTHDPSYDLSSSRYRPGLEFGAPFVMAE